MEPIIQNILLVEDNVHDAEMTIRALKKNHVTNPVLHLTDGQKALNYMFFKGEFADRDAAMPVLILLDLKMPKVDGFEVLQALKANEATKHVPIVILASSKLHPDIETGMALGADNYIVKPVNLEGFITSLSQLEVGMCIMNAEVLA